MRMELDTMKHNIVKLQEQLANIHAQPILPEPPNSKCTVFMPDNSTMSATKCKFCGREQWDHYNPIR